LTITPRNPNPHLSGFTRGLAAQLKERFIFNFAIPPVALEKLMNRGWLRPQIVGGAAVASFCMLRLEHLAPTGIPDWAGVRTVSSAYRFGAMDFPGGVSRPCVFALTRYSTSAWGRCLRPLGFPWKSARSVISQESTQDGDHRLRLTDLDGDLIFSAAFRPAKTSTSRLFPSVRDFQTFIKEGVVSYSPSYAGSQYAVVDLEKDDTTYAPMQVMEVEAPQITQLTGVAADSLLDSALRTQGGTYRWTYRGLIGE